MGRTTQRSSRIAARSRIATCSHSASRCRPQLWNLGEMLIASFDADVHKCSQSVKLTVKPDTIGLFEGDPDAYMDKKLYNYLGAKN